MPGVTTAYQTGVHGSRPANGAGCILYSCTTHSLVYRDDGSSWTTFLTLPSGGYTPGGTDVAVADGGTGASTAAGAATNLGLGTGDSPQFTAVNLGHASDTTLTRVSAGVVAIEGTNIVKAGSLTTSGLTQNTARLIGRTSASAGAHEEITVGTGLSLSAGSLTATGAAGSGPGVILGITYNTAGDQSITSATMADLPTSISVTFTAPASGNVLVVLATTCGATNTANAYQSWGVRESTSTIAGAVGESIAVRQGGSGSESLHGASVPLPITGISAGSHTYKWAAACSTSGGTFKANSSRPAVMMVIELP